MGVDFEAILAEARRSHLCAVCGEPLGAGARSRAAFCSSKCRDRFRHRRRYAEHGDEERARSLAYYRAHREEVLDRRWAERGLVRPPERTTCEECGGVLPAGRKVVCSSRCREARYRRLHPESYAERERRKVERRRAARRAAREAGS